MCGISGIINTQNEINEELNLMTSSLNHRGPDSNGTFITKIDSTYIGLGHTRLSILDLTEAGHQPMSIRNVSISFNGEIYNFLEIRKELELLGQNFQSNSDTEVILRSYLQWGIDKTLSKLNGMFAFALVDEISKEMFLCRDRLGVKPLYFSTQEGLFLFGSEIKAILNYSQFAKNIDNDSLYEYLQFGYILEPNTIFKGISKVRAGNYLTIDLTNLKVRHTRYWDLEKFISATKLNYSQEQHEKHIENLIRESCEYRMIADVPIGVFLSGGYDSTTIAAILQNYSKKKIKTFTIGFENERFDESKAADKIAQYLGTEHHTKILSTKDSIGLLDSIYNYYDEPLADDSIIPTMAVSKLARKYVTVALSADGADEIFIGYPKYTEAIRIFNRNSKFKSLNRSIKYVSNLVKYFQVITKGQIQFINFISSKLESISHNKIGDVLKHLQLYFSENELNQLLIKNHKSRSSNFDNLEEKECKIDEISLIDTKTYMLDNILVKVDRATMAFSLEGREPMIDYRIVEYLAQIPGKVKFKNGKYKYLLKRITHKYIPSTLLGQTKKGFSLPIKEWINNEDFIQIYIETYFSKEYILKQGLFSFSEIENLLDQVYSHGNAKHIKNLWALLMFQLWYDKWMN